MERRPGVCVGGGGGVVIWEGSGSSREAHRMTQKLLPLCESSTAELSAFLGVIAQISVVKKSN